MGLTRSSSGLKLFDDFSSDTSADYDAYSGTIVVSGGEMTLPNHIVHKTASGVYCVTSKILGYKGGHMSGPALWANSALDAAADIDGYVAEGLNANVVYMGALTDNSASWLANGAYTQSAGNYIFRLYRNAATVYMKIGTTALDGKELSSNNTAYTGTLYPGMYYKTNNHLDWLEGRTAHTITCTGMTTGHYLRVSDGTTAAEAQESSGTATVDAGAVLFPLASVQIRTAAAGGGDLIAELTTTDYADMGGGDAFAYSSASAKPIWLFKTQYIPQLGGVPSWLT